MSHTPGKLMVGKHGVISGGIKTEYTNGSAYEQIAMVCIVESGDKEENTRRLVAAWNALEGFTTEELESASLGEIMGKQAFLNSFNASKGGADFELGGGACGLLASCFAGQFVGTGAANFIEVRMSHPEVGNFSVTMQKLNGKTPAELHSEVVQERDKYLAWLKEIQGALIEHLSAESAGDHVIKSAKLLKTISEISDSMGEI